MTTNLPVAAAFGRGGELFVFAVGADQQILFNRRTSDGWASTWTAVPGTARTKHSVAACTDQTGNVLVVHTGLNGKLYHAWYTDGSWTAWEPLDDGAGSTAMPMALASGGKEIAWFLTGNNKHVYADGVRYYSADLPGSADSARPERG
ncbi:hypothetical protein ACIQWZ_40225 [Streptomyces sp. NPDC098077]|uniref:hypothetical protein n=1 Tax=Streptomyces sp. NPDC098077 TaxID=3366093 RepID=UPI0038134DD4